MIHSNFRVHLPVLAPLHWPGPPRILEQDKSQNRLLINHSFIQRHSVFRGFPKPITSQKEEMTKKISVILFFYAFNNIITLQADGAEHPMLLLLKKRQADADDGNAPNNAAVDTTTPAPTPFTDYLTGKLLTDDAAKKCALVTKEEENIITFQANVPGATESIALKFKQTVDTCTQEQTKNNLAFKIRVCKKGDGKCPGGAAICFPGMLDGKNSAYEHQVALSNVHEEIAKVCKDQQKKWTEWTGKELHTVLFTADGSLMNIEASFVNEENNKLFLNIQFGDDGCVDMHVGTEECSIGFVETTAKILGQNFSDFSARIINGDRMEDQALNSVLPYNLLLKYQAGKKLLAFIGTDDCNIDIKLDGQGLEKCSDRTCSTMVRTAYEQKQALYQEEFDNLKAMHAPDQVPAVYNSQVQFEKYKKDGRPRALITTGDKELPFAIVTKTDVPPNITILWPEDPLCHGRDAFDQNTIVLAYNGVPDCYTAFAWGERALRVYGSSGSFNRYVITWDVTMTFGGNERDWIVIWDQHKDMQMAAKANCAIKAERMQKPVPGRKDHIFMWKFVLNPEKGGAPQPEKPKCAMLGVGVYVDHDVLMFPDIPTE